MTTTTSNTNTNSNYANANYAPITAGSGLTANQLGPILATVYPDTIYGEGLNFKLIKAHGGFILEVVKSAGIGYTPAVNKYILKEKSIGKQIEKIIALELLKK